LLVSCSVSKPTNAVEKNFPKKHYQMGNYLGNKWISCC